MSKETVEINGVKFEIDMDTAKRIDTFKVGDNVSVVGQTVQFIGNLHWCDSWVL
ncbi:hypothetical protein [Lactiplantibacillus plantarum]|uniref:hypothetical protein n=1 Tax=Lactiplantibacillus plantarum TaxID=1590 RepID=UPI0021A305DF|nr:hypothetical protein [Lactiplantibacillus plantarum]